MENITYTCDIEGREHSKLISRKKLPMMFDHDQEDGKMKMTPYFEMLSIDICEDCFSFMTDNSKVVYAYGAMGYNNYFLRNDQDHPLPT